MLQACLTQIKFLVYCQFYNFRKENNQKAAKFDKRTSTVVEKSETKRKLRKDSALQAVSPNTDGDSDTQEKFFKTKDKLLMGKENSPKKKRSTSVVSQDINFLKIKEELNTKKLPQASSSRVLKQKKLRFLPSTKSQDSDSTFDDVLKKSNTEKTISQKLVRNASSPLKKKKSIENSLRVTVTDSNLFAFRTTTKNTKTDSTIVKPAVDPDETPNLSQLMIKQENITETVNHSDADMFPSDLESSQGSSVAFINNEDQVIVITDEHNERSNNLFLHELEQKFIECSEYKEPVQRNEPIRKRERIYGDCRDCIEARAKHIYNIFSIFNNVLNL